jgi:hypothetical protein
LDEFFVKAQIEDRAVRRRSTITPKRPLSRIPGWRNGRPEIAITNAKTDGVSQSLSVAYESERKSLS